MTLAVKACLAAALLLLLLRPSAQNFTYVTKYIDVPLDHFTFTSNATFKLRYLYNDNHWNRDGPIFFYTGNEGSIETFAQNTGFVWKIAEEFRALVIFAEHRYYGKSLPFGNKSFSEPKYLGYLSSTQALADYVYLIQHLQKSNTYNTSRRKNPVVAFGGSYGGMLAAWIRMKYPASVLGAIAASAPVWQFQGLTPCGIYNRILTSVYRASFKTHDCAHSIRSSWPTIRQVSSTPEGKTWISSNWKLCKPLQNKDDIQKLIDWLAGVYSNLAMTNYPYPSDFLAPVPAYPVKKFCSNFNNTDKPKVLLEQLGKALSVYTNYTGHVKCVDINQGENGIDATGWYFQACTEMVMPMCSKDEDMFENYPWNFTKFSEDCYHRWKVQVARPDLALLEYGGKDLQAASNIVFSNGLLDPWSGGGVVKNISKTVLAIIIPEGAHHLDLREANDADPYSVITARNFHRRIIQGWLQSYYNDQQNNFSYNVL